MTQLGVAPEAGELDPAERMSVDELRALQLDRLRWTLRHAYANVAFYRKKFDAAGVSPEDCRSLEDLASFPVTTKDDLRENYPTGMFAVPAAELRRIHASSGTTGQPTVVGYTQADVDTWSGLMARSIRAAGGRPGDMVHVAYGYGLFTGGLGGALRRRAAGLHGHPRVGRHDRTAGQADRRPAAAGDHGHSDLHADHLGRV